MREDLILHHVEQMRVLDCGGADHDAFESKTQSGEWLHQKIAARAKECIGVDILKSRVEQINKGGQFRFVEGNVEKLNFHEEFDVVVGGEIIEHVYNAGLFLDSAWRALKPGGKLILTTPNAYSLTGFLYAAFSNSERCHPEHVCYYSRQTLTYLVSRNGFEVQELHLIPRPANSRWIEWGRRIISKIAPLLSEKIVLIAKKSEKRLAYEGVW